MHAPLMSELVIDAVFRHMKQILHVGLVDRMEPDNRTCFICLEQYLSGDSPEFPITLRCGHTIGAQCFWTWFAPWTRQHHGSCPICRANIVREWELVPGKVLYGESPTRVCESHDSRHASTVPQMRQALEVRSSQPKIEKPEVHRLLDPKAYDPIHRATEAITVSTPAFPYIPYQQPNDRQMRCIQMTSIQYENRPFEPLQKPKSRAASILASFPELEDLHIIQEPYRVVRRSAPRRHEVVQIRAEDGALPSASSTRRSIPSTPSHREISREPGRFMRGVPVNTQQVSVPRLRPMDPSGIVQAEAQTMYNEYQTRLRHQTSRIRAAMNGPNTFSAQGASLMSKLCEALIRHIERLDVGRGLRRKYWVDVAVRILNLVPLTLFSEAVQRRDPDTLLLARLVPQEYNALLVYLSSGTFRDEEAPRFWEAQKAAWLRRIDIIE
ncbi:MAG: hypothetical protein Q9164_001025 [Protoblastenia rupestris]